MAPAMGSVPPEGMSSGFIMCPSTCCVAYDRSLLVPCWPLLSDYAVTVIQASGLVVRWKYSCFTSRQPTDPTHQEFFLQGSQAGGIYYCEQECFRYCQTKSNGLGPAALCCWGLFQGLLICGPCPWFFPSVLWLQEKEGHFMVPYSGQATNPMTIYIQSHGESS